MAKEMKIAEPHNHGDRSDAARRAPAFVSTQLGFIDGISKLLVELRFCAFPHELIFPFKIDLLPLACRRTADLCD